MANPSSSLFKLPMAGKKLVMGPSCNEILPRLYLGDICTATNKEEISRLGITDMITVEIKPLQANELAPSVRRYLYINVMDHSKQDILSHFETSNDFIETALKNPSNKLYVHCVAGISRSATLVIAYIMKTRSMNYQEAFELVSQKRRIVDPNEGFVRQLVLYHKMKFQVDIGNLEYRRMVLDALVFEFRLVALSYYQTHAPKTAPTVCGGSSSSSGGSSGPGAIMLHGLKNLGNKNNVGILFDQYYNKLNLQQVSKFTQVYEPQTAFRCNKCRAIVFYAISVIENKLQDLSGGGGGGLESIRSSSSNSARSAESKTKDQDKLSTLRAIRSELNKVIKTRQDGAKDPSIEHMLGLFRANQVTEKRFCRPEDHYKYFAETYLTYLKSLRLQDELTNKYFNKGERSIQDSARLVGLELPKQSH